MALEGLYKSWPTECFYSLDPPTPVVKEDPLLAEPAVGSAHTALAAMPPIDHKTKPTAHSEPEPAIKNEVQRGSKTRALLSSRARSDQVREPAIISVME